MKRIVKATVIFTLIICSMLLVMCMNAFASEEYVLCVGGVPVTSENASDILGDGKVSYDSETKTLLLDNASITQSFEFKNVSEQSYTAVIYAQQELNIVVKGFCSIYSDAVNSYNDYCIVCFVPDVEDGEPREALTISGYDEESTLIVSSANTVNETSALYTLCADIKIENLDLTCYAATGVQSNVIYANDAAIYIADSTVLCKPGVSQTQTSGLSSGLGVSISGTSDVRIECEKCDYSVDSDVNSYGILTLGTLEISGESKLYSRAGQAVSQRNASSQGVCATSVVVSDNASIEAYGYSAGSSDSSANCTSIGIAASEILVTDNGVIDGNGSGAGTASAGVYGNSITIEGNGKVYGSCPISSSGVYSPIACNAPINGEGTYVYDAEATDYLEFVPPSDGFPGYYVNASGEIPYKMVATPCMEFNTWLGGTRITSENCDDIFGDGTASYDHKTRTLTLNNATITDTYAYRTNTYTVDDGNGGQIDVVETETAGIYSKYPLIIEIIGDVVIDCSDDTAEHNTGIYLGKSYSSDVETHEIICVGDEASLTVKSGGTEESYGIFVDDSGCIMKDLNIDVTAGETTSKSVAMFVQDADYSLTISNCDADFKGGDVYGSTETAGAGGMGGGSIYIKDGSNVTASSGNVYAGTGSGNCAGVIIIGYFDVSGESTFNAYGGDVYTENGTAQSMGMFIVGMVTLGENCNLNTYGGDVHHSGDATAETAQSVGFGLTLSTITIEDNAVMNAYGGYSDGGSCGVYIEDAETTPEYDETVVFATETGILNAGSLNTNTDATNVGLYVENPVENGTVRNVETGEVLQYNNGVYTDSDGNLVANTTVNGGVIYFGDYNLAVGDVVVTKANKDDIFGDRDEGVTAYYDDETNTLTLDNANITTLFNMDGTYAGILCMNGLNVNLVGYNTVDSTNYPEIGYTGFCVAVAGDLVIHSEKDAVLDVTSGKSTGENYAVYLVSLTEGGVSDLTVSGKAKLIARGGDVDFEYYSATSAGIYVTGKIDVVDGASISAYGGVVLPGETNTESSHNAMSVGIVAMGEVTVNTTGKVYGFGEKAATVFGGMGFVGGLVVEKGIVIGEAGKDVPEGAMSIGLCTTNDVENVNVKTGSSEEDLYDGTWNFVDEIFGGAYLYNGANIGTYTVIVSEKFFGDLEVNRTEDDDTVTDSVSVVISGYDDVVLVFASYDAYGRMIDMRFEDSQNADDIGRVVCERLVLDGAETVKAFAFENRSSFKPLTEQVENSLFSLNA